ncbi:D-tagatose-bisphosphate aldolase, class II, non-catalytic subunit [Tessaracoccus caeni]|uniref:D-tagatose-bisphosphate aldolase, class II, non-catalytic subunit n=1 Tax=Tessaracoccus caeni TaxID=3031239 RepID=UPI0023DC82DC|nr:D-tagatose-bisphosphate aldolase, class II, non-catalytic subunit [Tessaracoccus caeni]MDF1489336.1 D-tagatose-bisphosphate aldolase, class II, non-catalytic subunit [Tessaracoccus caeni]
MTQDHLRQILGQNKAGQKAGIYSVCSAHPLVLEASMRQAKQDGSVLLIEATSNQVDQFGGYTGMTPVDFREFVYGIAENQDFAKDRIILGGDHLGPNRWQKESPDTAMDKAEDLVRAYVAAGYTKIHLDCSMSCAGDPVPLTDEIVAQRAARLLVVAEQAAKDADLALPVSYVIGTEVPVPGGAHETLHALTPTSREAAQETIAAHKKAFAEVGLAEAWEKVVAIVVQPAVEFDHVQVIDYVSANTTELQTALADEPTLLFEAHSTDYQTEKNLSDLVDDHWAILKVGPGLTFNLREAFFALDAIEGHLVDDPAKRSDLVAVMDEVMVNDPGDWASYYEGSAHEQAIARKFSYSDRIRYYLPNPTIVAAYDRMVANLTQTGIPEPLISQYLPKQFDRVREQQLAPTAHELIVDRVRDALRPYAAACGF